MKTISVRLIMTFVLLNLAVLAFADPDKVWVTSEDATLQSERSTSSETVATLKRGTQLSVSTFENRWYKVIAPDGKTGWIFRGKVSAEPPADIASDSGSGGIGGLLGGLTGSSIEADAADSSRSIRGLSPEAQEYANQTGTPAESRAALDMVLSLTMDKSDIDLFLKEGKIGEYAY
ncbi:MAG: SH3 domain-containing protein [Desulfobacteraceae bacterium]|jgi:hypothetical protein|nr:MAG: SH3 domain-containing protein [Desulfobacteraceae bacterium]